MRGWIKVKITNNHGYALVIVLLVITIFMIVGLTAIGISFNTAKQNQVIAAKSHSTAIAEMGMTYYETMIKNIYETNQQTISDNVKQNSTQTSNSAAQTAASQMMSTIKTRLDNEETTQVNIPDDPGAYFKIQSPTTYDTTNNKITLKVNGVEGNKTTTLSTDITITPITSGGGQTGGSAQQIALYSSTGVLISPNYIQKPTVNSLCQNPSSLDLLNIICNNTALLLGSNTYTKNLNNLANKTFYSTGALTISKNGNSMTNVQIHSDDSLTVGGNMNQGSGNVFETVHDAIFGGQLRLNSSKLYVGGNLTTSDHMDLANHTTAYIVNNATIAKSLSVDSTSTLCVGGILTVNGQVQSVASMSNVVLKGDASFETKCMAPSDTQTVQINWPSSSQLFSNTSYDY